MQLDKTPINNMRYLLCTIFTLFSPILLASNITQATDSLLRLLKTTQSVEKRIQIYRDLADLNLDTSDFKTYLLKMYNEASTISDRESMLNALHDVVVEEINANTYCKDSIVKYIDLIKEAGTPEDIEILLPLYHMRLFDSLCYLGKNKEAMKEEMNFLDSKSDATNNVYKDIASTYNIGSGFYMSKESEKAVPYLIKASKMAESIPEKYRFDYQKLIIRRLCLSYGYAHNEKESVKLMEDLIQLTEKKYETSIKKQRPFYKIELYLLQYYSYIFTSISYLTKEKEEYYWNKTQEIRKKIISDFDKYNYYLCASNYYSNNRTHVDLHKTIVANDSLIKFAVTLAPRNLAELHDNNASLYEQLNDYKNALKYLRASYQIRDSLKSQDVREQLNELQVRYDVNTLNSEKAQLEIKNKKMVLISLSFLLAIIVIICTYLYFSWKKERRMKTQLKALHLKAQESEKMKQAFINSICHEIRTPLNAIVGFSDLIMNEEIDEEMRREFPPEIQKNTKLLTSLVNSMLEVANLDVSEEKLPCELTDLQGICIQEMDRLPRNKEIACKLNIPEGSQLIMTNATYLSQVIEHLLSNAYKFTEKGEIILSYTIDKSVNRIYISVTDTGCGIPPEKHEEVFNRFSKLDTFIPGNGLGLYLCRLIMKRLGGEIKIDPSYTKGTRMIVTLPEITGNH